ncbi:MAG: diguanylate cyclase [Magnetococcales bacterium]|nr:diguanylate cyclase [Magnetococcales bacterium]
MILEKLAAARQKFADRLPDRMREIQETWKDIGQDGWTIESFQAFHRMVHNLAGTSGTFGFPDVGRAARRTEVILKEILRNESLPNKEQEQAIANGLRFLYQTAGSDTGIDTDIDTEPATAMETPSVVKKADEKRIFLVDAEADQTQELATQLQYYGYTIDIFSTLAEFRKGLEETEPAAVIMSTQLPDGQGNKAISVLEKKRDSALTVVFISNQDDLDSRLKTVRAGGKAFFRKPVDISLLVDTLDNLVVGYDPEAFRVCIIEDSRSLAEHFSLVLQGAGMRTCVVTDPLQVMEPLTAFQPDLILMDLYMPGCSGLELASVLRQQESFLTTPIVFLSAETDITRQLAAMSLGGDDFLTKPILPDHLISSVISRISRARKLRSLMVRDGLTGLYNHTTTRERLIIEVDRAKRQKDPLAFAMLDIDKFKAVNDTYGHPTGDRVIKSLARLLKQRLRNTDIVGRFGGEEFAVILVGTDGETASHIMNELREAFGKIEHRFEEISFQKTFSCGIAMFPHHSDPSTLNDAADKALYQAKNGGRNLVVLAE